MNNGTPPEDQRGAVSIFAEFLARRDEGKTVDFEKLVAQHPRHDEHLRTLYAELQRFGPILERAVPPALTDHEGMPPLDGMPPVDPAESLELERLRVKLERISSKDRRYAFRRVLGRGSFGVVVEAWDRQLLRTVAVKVALRRNEELDPGSAPLLGTELTSRFVQEAEILGQLDHPGVVPVHELGADDVGRPYFTMRLVQGATFESLIDDVHAQPPRRTLVEALHALGKVCDTVAYAHSRGIVHRDLTPSNVMVGEFGVAYVMDWGLARRVDMGDGASRPQHGQRERDSRGGHAGTRDGQILGTPYYMPPEQACGASALVGLRADVYALGAILYHLLAGRAPYSRRGEQRSGEEIADEVRRDPPEPLALAARRAPIEIVSIAEKAMARDEQARYASTADLAADLRAYLEGRVVSAHETGTWAEARKWILRNRALSTAIAGTVLALVVGIVGQSRAVVLANDKQTVSARLLQFESDERLQSERVAEAERERALQAERAASAERERSRIAEEVLAIRSRLLLRNVDIGVARRDFSSVLELLAELRTIPGADTLDLDLREARVRLAIWDEAGALAILRRLAPDQSLGERRGEALVMLAQAGMAQGEFAETWRGYAEEALELELSTVDRVFAEGLLCTRTDEALARFERALELDPLHQGASACSILLLAVTERHAEAAARADLFRRLYPRDLNYVTFLALIQSLQGGAPLSAGDFLRPDAARSPRGDADGPRSRAAQRIQKLLRSQPADALRAFDPWMQEAAGRMLYAWESLRKNSPRGVGPGLGAIGLPCLAESWGKAMLVVKELGSRAPDITAVLRDLRAASAVHEDAFFSCMEAYAVMETEEMREGPAGLREMLKEAIAALDRGAGQRSLFPEARLICRYWGAHAKSMLARGKHAADPAWLQPALESLRSALDLPPGFDGMLGLLAADAQRLEEPDLARRLQERQVRSDPTDETQVVALATYELASGMHGRALSRIDALLRNAPGHGPAIDLRTQILLAATELSR